MTDMLLGFQMPAGINGTERMPTTNAGSDTVQLNAAPSRLSLFVLDPANTARGCRALVPAAIQAATSRHGGRQHARLIRPLEHRALELTA